MDHDSVEHILQKWKTMKSRAKKRSDDMSDMESEEMSSPDLDTKKPNFKDMSFGDQIEYVAKRSAERKKRGGSIKDILGK